MCHDYVFTEPSVDGGAWRVDGRVHRYHPEDWGDPPGNWPHWKANEDDRYKLTLVPVAEDTAYWENGDVDIVNVRIMAGADTIPVTWSEVIDMIEAYKDRISPIGKPQPQQIRFGKRSFESAYFHISLPVPDTLQIEFELELIDSGTREVIDTWKITTSAVIDRHRRWHIVDMSQS
jgi:hypothetical protein